MPLNIAKTSSSFLKSLKLIALAAAAIGYPVLSQAQQLNFLPKVDLTTGTTPQGVAVGDLDGDGKIDIATVNNGSNTVSVFRNISSSGSLTASSFAAKVDFTTGNGPQDVTIADVNGDGKPELIVTNFTAGTVSVFPNNSTSGSISSSSFGTKVDFTTGGKPFGVATGDMDGDGYPEIIVANNQSTTVSVFKNNGNSNITSSSFATKVDFSTGNNPQGVAVADLDGDGKKDIAVANYLGGSVSVFRNTYTSGAISTSSFASKVDFNAGNKTYYICLGDEDGDGKTDIIVTNSNSSTISIFRNTASSGSITSSSFAAKVDFSTNSKPFGICTVDLDNDGKREIAVANSNATNISVYGNVATSGTISATSFSDNKDFTTGTTPYGIASADLDGDGKKDIVVANSGSNTISIFRNEPIYGINGNSSVCVGGTITLSDTLIGGTWTSSGSAATVSSAGVVTGVSAGTVTITYAKGGYVTKSITINALPTVTLTASATTICTGGTTTLTGGGAVTYSWSPATDLNASTGSPVYCSAASSRTYTVTGTDAAGCSNTASKAITVNTTPTVTVTPVSSAICNGSSTSITAAGATSYSWSPSTGLNNTTATTVNCTTTSTRSYTVTGTTSGCSSTASLTITVNTLPTVASITASPTSLAAGNTLSLTAGATSGTGTLTSYNWSGPNSYSTTGTSSTTSLVPSSSAGSGVYSLSVTYSNGCTSAKVSSSSVTVTNQAPKITSVSPNAAAPGASVTITGSNFSSTAANNIVYFGATKASVSSASTTSLTVTVPSGATLAPITVLNNEIPQVAYEDSAFTPIFSNSSFKNDTLNFKNYLSIASTLNTASHPYGAAIGDLDGDGKPDLVVNNLDSSSLSIFRNISSTGTLSGSSFSLVPARISLAGKPNNIKLADIDGDGKLDVVAALTNNNNVEIIRNTTTSVGSITFATRIDAAAGAVAAVAAITDFDGDGKSDIAVSLPSGKLGFFRNTSTVGAVSFATISNVTVGTIPSAVCFADLDGDGKPDFAVTNAGVSYLGTTASIARNTSSVGTISFGTVATLTTGTGPTDITAADIDGDSKPELLVANYNSGSISIFHNVASSGSLTASSFDSKVDLTLSAGTIGLATADFNGDGKIDVAVSNMSANTITIFRNKATSGTINTASFAAGLSYATGSSPVTVTAGDLDGDKYPDLVVGNSGSNSISIIKNYPLPQIGAITGSTIVCTSATTTLSNSVSGGIWSTSNTTKATINASTGVVTGVAAGTDTVYYSVIAGGDTSQVYAVMTINPASFAGTITGGGNVCLGSSIVLSDATPSGTWSSSNTDVATVSGGTVTTVAAGTATIFYTVTNSCGTTVASASVTVNAVPAFTLGTAPSVCAGAGTALQSYTSATGNPTTYSVVYDAAAHTAGFADVTSAPFTPGTISYTVPVSAAAGTYNATVTLSNGSCSTGYTTSINNVAYPVASLTSATQPCSGYSTDIIYSATTGATLDYKIDGGSLQSAVVSGGSFTISTGEVTSTHTYQLVDIHNGTCTSNYGTITTINPVVMQWTGTADTNWHNAANWSCGFVPGTNDDVTIPALVANKPSVSANATTRNLTMAANATLKVNSGVTLSIKGDLTNNSTISGAGTISMNGATAQLVKGAGYISNLDINNTTGVTISSTSACTVSNKLSISNGILNTGDSLVLNSDSTATAYVAPMTTYGTGIMGNVQVKQFIESGHRAYRFWSHPFSSYIAIAQMEKYVDITGAGGAANGFTGTITNSPSCFRYNTLTANSSLGYDPGWRAFTNTNGVADSNKFNRYQGIRMFIRGAKGEGLSGEDYTPSSVTIGMTGPLNQGMQIVHLAKGSGANQDYNMVGNPYASPVDIGTIAHNAKASGNIVGSAIFLWDPYVGPVGNWVTVPVTTASPYYIQAYTSFQVRAAHNNDSLIFTENDKAAAGTNSVLKTASEYMELSINDNNNHRWDMLRVTFDNDATDKEDNDFDAVKPSGPSALNFYSISADDKKMAIDGRPYVEGNVIPLGITSSYAQEFTIHVSAMPASAGKVYLHDKLQQTYTLLQQGTDYKFAITADKNTQGDNRFELKMGSTTENAVVASNMNVSLTPNPATDNVNVSFSAPKDGSTAIRITDISGACVYNNDLGNKQAANVNISLAGYATGIYMVELTHGNDRIVKKLIKE